MLDGFKKFIGRKGEVVLVSDDTFEIIGSIGGITAGRLTRDLARCSEGGHLGLFVELTIDAEDMEADAWAEYVAALVSFVNCAPFDACDLLAEMNVEMADDYAAEDAADVAANAAPVVPATWCSMCASVAGACRH